MAIRYIIPAVSPQQGPTCWYYTMKMLFRFHRMIGPAEELHKQWKALHHLRRACSAFPGRTSPTPAKLADWLRDRSQKEKSPALDEAVRIAASLANTDRFTILDAFLPGRMQQVSVGGAYDAAFIERSLRSYGPMYASIGNFSAGPLDFGYVPDPMRPGSYVYEKDGFGIEGGRHAILIAGIDDDARVYYNDPQVPHRFTMAPWSVLSQRLYSPGGSLGSSLFGAVVCPACSHLTQR